MCKINWAPKETLFDIGDFGIRIYSLMFVIAFSLGYFIFLKIYRKENIDTKYVESIFVYMIVSTLLGARLGDVFFYSWDYYQNHLIEILLPIREHLGSEMFFGIIKGYEFVGFRGLASHGATLGIIVGLYLYHKKYPYKPFLWILDRVTIPIAIGGSFVRLGNFFNSEIVGKYTQSDFGVVFLNRGETEPRHPAQLYEAIAYIILFFILYKLYNSNMRNRTGYLLGVFFITLFTARFLIEFVKESQGGFERFMPFLSTGQWLSVPFILLGIFLVWRASRNNLNVPS